MKRHKNVEPAIERVVRGATRWLGSPVSLGVHTLLFAACFLLIVLGYPLDTVLLTLTTAVSLEAIYLSLFIQMSVNRTSISLEAVEEDVAEIVEDIDEIQEDVAEIEKSIDEIEEDVDEIQEDVAEIEKSVDEIEEDIAEIEKDVDEMEKDDEEHHRRDAEEAASLKVIESRLAAVLEDLEKLRRS
jgi:septal ring factor EnvC (AmiA/AmiB activator)